MTRTVLTRLGAALTLLLGATVVAAAPATAAPRQVALLVQYPGGSVRTWCVPFRSGLTGADVLAPARPTYGAGPYAGFVLKITGRGTVPPTADAYWAYWRSPTGRRADYAYSTGGATTTRPSRGGVEAWVWTTGGTTTFPHRTFTQICGA